MRNDETARVGSKTIAYVWQTLCTTVPLRASVRVSPGFNLLKQSSTSFGPSTYAHTQASLNSLVGWRCKNPSNNFHCAFKPDTRGLIMPLLRKVRLVQTCINAISTSNTRSAAMNEHLRKHGGASTIRSRSLLTHSLLVPDLIIASHACPTTDPITRSTYMNKETTCIRKHMKN